MDASETPCRVAFIGAGYMTREHVKAFSDVPGVELAGIFSRTRTRAEKLATEFQIAQVCDSISDLHTKALADLVVVSVPELATRDICLACFDHPWIVLVEKPAGYNVPDAEVILDVAKVKGRKAYVALNRRHYSSTLAMLKDLSNRDGPRLIRLQDQEDPVAALKVGQPEEVVRHWMYANSIHLIDYFPMLGRGEISAVDPIVRWAPDNPGYVVAKISFSSGDVGLYEAVWNGPAPWAVNVFTPSRRWELRPLEKALFQDAGSRLTEECEIHSRDKIFKPGLRRQAELAVRCVRGEEGLLPTLADAMVSMRLAQAIYA